MRPEEDDEPGIGPPPDPSVRAWRHPSEIAAAARCSQPPEPRGARGSTVVALSAALAVAVVFGATAVANLGFASGDSIETLTQDASGGRSGSAALLPPGSGPEEEEAAKVGPLTTRTTPDAASLASTTRSGPGGTEVVRTASTLAPTTTAAVTVTVTSHPTVLNPTTGQAWPTAQGVHAAGSAARLASFTLIDGLVVTSASALSGQSDVELRVGPVIAAATLAATDPITDLAVLTVDSRDLETIGNALATAGPSTIEADVIGTDQMTVLANGQHVYGSLLTSTTRPAGAAGAPLAADGEVVGVILDADATLISALPIAEVVEVVGTLVTWDVGSLAWVGLAGVTTADGGAQVADVIDGAPADQAGIQPADRITAIDGVTVRDWSQVVHLTRSAGPGRSMEVQVDREGKVITVKVTIGSRLES